MAVSIDAQSGPATSRSKRISAAFRLVTSVMAYSPLLNRGFLIGNQSPLFPRDESGATNTVSSVGPQLISGQDESFDLIGFCPSDLVMHASGDRRGYSPNGRRDFVDGCRRYLPEQVLSLHRNLSCVLSASEQDGSITYYPGPAATGCEKNVWARIPQVESPSISAQGFQPCRRDETAFRSGK